MTQDIHIPPEAVEAAAKQLNPRAKWTKPNPTYAQRVTMDVARNRATAAIRAALENWPGMTTRTGLYTDLILPLTETSTKENDNG